LGTAEFVYNNKVHSSMKTLPFKANYEQDPRMEFKGRKKGKYEGAEKFMEKMKKIQEEVKAVLGKVQKDIKKYADRKRAEADEYKVRDLVMLSTKCKVAKLQARIKPTALCSAIDKENSIEFLLDFLHYLYNYYMVCALLFHTYHVTHHVMSCDCDTVTVTM